MSETKRKIILKKIKKDGLDTIWHPESTLVFKSQKERLVIGSIIKGEFQSLDEGAIILCQEWNFKPDESLIEQDEEGEDEEGEDEGGEDEDEGDEDEEDEVGEEDEE